jgi:hypothetical protein
VRMNSHLQKNPFFVFLVLSLTPEQKQKKTADVQ